MAVLVVMKMLAQLAAGRANGVVSASSDGCAVDVVGEAGLGCIVLDGRQFCPG